MLTKKHIKKIEPQKQSNISADDDWSSITKSVGEKLDIEDIMDIQDRTITFGRKKIPLETITDDLQDRSSNTSQYVKLVNSYFKGKKSQIEKIIELTNDFDQEIQNLKSDNNEIAKLNDTPIHEIKSEEIKKLAQSLLKDREQRRENLQKLKNEIIKAEKGLEESDKRVEILNEEILDKKLKPNTNNQKQDAQLINALSVIMNKYEPKKISEALRRLNTLHQNVSNKS